MIRLFYLDCTFHGQKALLHRGKLESESIATGNIVYKIIVGEVKCR